MTFYTLDTRTFKTFTEINSQVLKKIVNFQQATGKYGFLWNNLFQQAASSGI